MMKFEVKIFGKTNGSLDGSSKTEVFQAQSKDELEKRLHEENIAYSSVKLVEEKTSQNFDFQRSNSKAGSKLNWHDNLNSWLVASLARLNACAFLLITTFCTLIGAAWIADYDESYLPLGIIVGFTIGLGIGLVYCGLFAIVLTATKDLNRIACALEHNSPK